jgi:hypothetical protein
VLRLPHGDGSVLEAFFFGPRFYPKNVASPSQR